MTDGAFGSSEVYPSKAAGYGVEGLMAMAGTMAERAEQAQGLGSPQVRALAGLVFAALALTQAVRDLPESVVGAVTQAVAEIEDTPETPDMTGLLHDLRLVLPRVSDQLTLTPAERAAATRLGILAREVG